ncbi:MAG: SusC/RagA family TonB-linked outer membrane protein, partial [Pyrinomonadaceae bacterium]|nr:SusC/RagA family TonB-linked outer membrane protein [Sphingobacteriaceae bacterium]
MRKILRIVLLFTILIPGSYVNLFAQSSQSRAITGTVYDENGITLPGASILVKDTKIGTSTDLNGKFMIRVPAEGKVLVVNFMGMASQEITIGSKTNLTVSLKSTNSNLNEVVVIGYGAIRKAEVTSSIVSITEKDIKNLPVSGIDQALQGKVAGVTVTNNGGQPGGGVSVRVRGITSVNGNEPLYVIDGVPILTQTNSIGQDQLGGRAGQTSQSVMSTINPSDIASVDILKDASAQAIYGSLAANGVVLITTKRGKSGQSKISYDVYYGAQKVQKTLPVMNLSEYAQYYNSVVEEAATYGSILQPIGEFKNPSLLGKGTDWQEAIYQTGKIANHQLSFSGGADKTTYYFSGNYFNQTGTIIGSGFQRFSTRFNLDQQVKSWLKAGISANLSRSNQKIALTDGTETPTTIVLYNSPATPITGPDGQYLTTTSLGSNTFGNSNGNPIATASLRDVKAIQSIGYGNIFCEIKFMKYLSLRNEVGFDFQLSQNSAFQPEYTNSQTKQSLLSPSKLIESRNNS